MKRKFLHSTPKFGTKNSPSLPSTWSNSIYYLWFEYLRRNEDYRLTCENGGKGKCAKIYKNFGDIYSQDFKTWWQTNDNGANLFAEKPKRSIEIIQDKQSFPKNLDETLVLSIPLSLSSSYLINRFKQILKKQHKGKRGERSVKTGDSSATCKLATKRIAIHFLQTALKVLDKRNENPEMPLWQVAQELNLAAGSHIKLGEDGKVPRGGHVANQKKIMAATASRYIRKAEAAIANAGAGKFPDYTIESKTSSRRGMKIMGTK